MKDHKDYAKSAMDTLFSMPQEKATKILNYYFDKIDKEHQSQLTQEREQRKKDLENVVNVLTEIFKNKHTELVLDVLELDQLLIESRIQLRRIKTLDTKQEKE